MCPNDAKGMANSVDPDQIAPLGAVWPNSVDPDQTAPIGAVWSGSTLFVQPCLSENFGSLRYVWDSLVAICWERVVLLAFLLL